MAGDNGRKYKRADTKEGARGSRRKQTRAYGDDTNIGEIGEWIGENVNSKAARYIKYFDKI